MRAAFAFDCYVIPVLRRLTCLALSWNVHIRSWSWTNAWHGIAIVDVGFGAAEKARGGLGVSLGMCSDSEEDEYNWRE